MEKQLLGVSMRSRHDHNLVRSYIDVGQKSYSKPFQVLMTMVGDYYARDGTADYVQPEVLAEQVKGSLRNDKHADLFDTFIAEAVASTHDANTKAVILLAKQQEVGDRLAVAITTGSENVDDLMREYNDLRSMTNLEQVADKGLEVYESIDLSELMQHEFDPSNLIKLYPLSLNQRVDGGAKREHHIVVYGRPESMKTGTAINLNCGFARQGLKTLYFINEDPASSVIMRHVSNLSGMTKYQIRDNPKAAQKAAYDNGFGNIIVVSCAPGTLGQLEAYVEKYDPAAIVVDQLRNLKVKADNRVNQLEYAATGVRNLAKQAKVLAVSITQAGDSGEGKAVLDMGDVDFSNTGIPAQADLMIGVGVTPELDSEGLRNFSLPKNKLSGDHTNFPVRVQPQLSRVLSV